MKLQIITLLLIAISCNDKVSKPKFLGNMQVPVFNSSDSKINIIGLDSVIKGSEFCASIIQTNPNCKITAAYIGSDKGSLCDFSQSLIDTSLRAINNCSISLMIKDYRGTFCLTPTRLGQFRYKLAVLSVDNNSTFYLDTLDLEFIAREKTYQ